jgi:hypothetical protein
VRRGRAWAVYGAAAALAVGIGAAAALLRPPPPSETSVHLRAAAESVDPAVAREQLIETLVIDARGAEDVERLPAFGVALTVLGGDDDGWALGRLLEPDVPDALVLALARRLPRRGAGPTVAARLLDRRLEAGSPEAVAVLKARSEGAVARDVVCRCSFGILGGWIAAWGPGIAWDPVRAEDGVTLRLRREEGGATALVMRREGVAAAAARDGEGPRIEAETSD